MDTLLIAVITLYVCLSLVGWGMLGRVFMLERRNPNTELTYLGVAVRLMLSVIPMINMVVLVICVIEYPQYFKVATRSIYKAPTLKEKYTISNWPHG